MEHEPLIADIVPTKCFLILYLHIITLYYFARGQSPPKKNTTDSVTKLQTINDLDQWPDVASDRPVTQRVPWDTSAPPESDRPMSAAVAEALPRNFQRWRS